MPINYCEFWPISDDNLHCPWHIYIVYHVTFKGFQYFLPTENLSLVSVYCSLIIVITMSVRVFDF